MKINKYLIVLFLTVVLGTGLIVAGIFYFKKPETPISATPVASDYKNLSYIIENQQIKLTNGYSEIEAAPGSSSKIVTRYFGNEAFGDINGNGTQDDIAFLLTQETGGSGVFYYLAVALKIGAEFYPTNTIFLGDRISPQTTQIHDGVIIVNYSDRKINEPMTANTSVGITRYFKIGSFSVEQGGKLVEQFSAPVFNSPVNLQVTKQVTYSDGLKVTLKQINDSRCRQGEVCIWAGELAPILSVSGGNIGGPTEIQLGTTNNKKVSKGGYVFNLQSATESAIMLVVEKDVPVQKDCYVGGCSNELCSDTKGAVSTCIYNPGYACYKSAICERQKTGQCGWTQTLQLTRCLNANS